MTLSPVVAVIDDRDDLVSWTLSRHSHHPGVVGVDVGVEERQSLAGLADAILVGLGKDPWLSVSKRPAELLAAAWLSLGETSDVLIAYAQLTSPRLMPTVVSWLTGLGVRPWLIYTHHGNRPAIEELAGKVAADWGVDVVDAATLFEAWSDVSTAAEPAVDPQGLPRLPRVDGAVFRSTCRQLLDADDFEAVDAEFTATVAEFRAALPKVNSKTLSRQFAQVVRDRLAGADCTELLLLTARAAQVAGFTAGLHVTVDTTMLLGAAEALPRTGLAGPERWFERLDVYRDPDPGAVAALYAAGCDPEVMPELTIGSLEEHPDGTVTIRDAAHHFEINDGARFVKAMAQFRRLSGAADGDALLATHRAGTVRPHFVSKLLYGTRTDTGVQVGSNVRSRRQPDAQSWLRRYGIGISKARPDAKGSV